MAIEINVNPYKKSSIEKAITELKAYRLRLKELPQKLLDAYAQRLGEILTEQAPPEAQGLWTYDTQNTDKGVVGIFTFKGEVEFIEFGTGIVGKEHHDGANMDWAEKLPPPYTGYESGPKINKQTHIWWYFDGQRVTFTKGQQANPFMYRSVQQLIQESESIARKVLYGQGQD